MTRQHGIVEKLFGMDIDKKHKPKLLALLVKLLKLTLLEDGESQVFDEELLSKIKGLPGVKEVRQLTGTTATVSYKDVYEEYYRQLYQSRYTPGDYDSDMAYYKEHPEDVKFTCRVIGVDDAEFALLNASVEYPLDEEAFLSANPM